MLDGVNEARAHMIVLLPSMVDLLGHLELSLLEFTHQIVALSRFNSFKARDFDTNLLFGLFGHRGDLSEEFFQFE